MKKKLLASVLALAMVAGLTACGSSSTAPATTAATTAAAAETTAATAETTAATAETAAGSASAWTPNSTVSLIIPASAGGDTDLSARVWAQYAKKYGIDAVVVNAGGASGSVAANQVLSAAADGYTVLYGHCLVNVANIAGITDYNYTAFKLGPTFAREAAQQLYANAAKYPTLDDFITAAKANPGKLKACTEVGAYSYYLLLGFAKAAGIELDLVDVGSNSEKIAALLGEQVDLMPSAYGTTKDYVTAGQFSALATPGAETMELIDNMPTLISQGVDFAYPDLDMSFYFPKDTPDDVIAKFEEVTKAICEDQEAIDALKNIAFIPYYLDQADSEKNEDNIYSTINDIAQSVK